MAADRRSAANYINYLKQLPKDWGNWLGGQASLIGVSVEEMAERLQRKAD